MTDRLEHPGVKQFINSGKYILSGKPYLLEKNKPVSIPNFELTPIQTRTIFSLNHWQNIIGFHSRNVPHRAHEYIQKRL